MVALLAMLQLDKQYYQIAKKDLIVDHFREYVDGPIGKERIDQIRNTDLWSSMDLEGQAESNKAAEFRKAAQSILDSPDNPVYRITLTAPAQADRQPLVLVDLKNGAKFKAKNTFSNSLFLRDFSSTAKYAPEGAGTLSIYYTSPQGDERIRELTLRYRWYGVFLLLTLTLLAGAVARSLLIPLQKSCGRWKRRRRNGRCSADGRGCGSKCSTTGWRWTRRSRGFRAACARRSRATPG